MTKYPKRTRTLLGTIELIDSQNSMPQPAYGIKNKNKDIMWLWEDDVDKIVLPTISAKDSHTVDTARRKGYGLAEFIKQYSNESEATLETLVEAWIHGYMER